MRKVDVLKRKYRAPLYIREQLADLALLQNGWYWDDQGRKIKRASLHAAHERFREYDGPRVHLYPTIEGHISAEFDLTESGYQHEDEIL
tara:strand:+ start:8015 stop:8281 length:267 start_codon:yes stop_codon:yes gene_type:complete